ncbi:MAG: FAD-binding oxidoreductase [Xanthomonadales bacterium]|nr:FAD-binding oxidoreductase [Xanthomonadales bacterium]
MKNELIGALKQRLGNNGILLGEDIGERYHCDWSGIGSQAPLAVLRPCSTEEVSFIMASCSAVGQAVVVQGGMTGLCGGSTPRPGEFGISLERMSGIEEIDSNAMTMTVLAGTPLETVQQKAGEVGLRFPLDLGARGSCTVGGNIATNAGGNQVIRYGMARALVLGLEAVLADGTVLTSLNKMLKNNAGFDLKHLFIGTEGTLGIVTRAVLRLFPVPLTKSTALCGLNNLEDGIQLLHFLNRKLGSGLSTFEVMWKDYVEYIQEHVSSVRAPFERHYAINVLTEFEGTHRESDATLFENVLGEAMEMGLIQDAIIAKSEKEASGFWRLRDAIGDVLNAVEGLVSFDISAPIGLIPKMLWSMTATLENAFDHVTHLTYGHLGDSNIHLSVTTGNEDDIPRISDIVYCQAGDFQGSISGEHGIGVMKKKYLSVSKTRSEIELMSGLKQLLDPKNILNPGRVVPEM